MKLASEIQLEPSEVIVFFAGITWFRVCFFLMLC